MLESAKEVYKETKPPKRREKYIHIPEVKELRKVKRKLTDAIENALKAKISPTITETQYRKIKKTELLPLEYAVNEITNTTHESIDNWLQNARKSEKRVNKKISKIIRNTEDKNIRENIKKLQQEGKNANKRWFNKVKGEYKTSTQMNSIKITENGKVKLKTGDEDIENGLVNFWGDTWGV